jgi:methylglutaconyl-CoA hydratase
MTFTRTELKNDILFLLLDRLEARNAYHPPMIAEICAALKTPARAVVISGAGPSFCAGADLKWMARAANLSPEENLQDALHLYSLYEAFWTCACPIIVYAHGRVFGGGVGLTAVADYAVAEESATFQLSEAKWGLIPGVATPFLIERLGLKCFEELASSGKEFGAQEALDMGLVSFVGKAEACVGEVQKRLNGALPKRPRNGIILDQAQEYARLIAEQRVSPEAKDSLAKFIKEP